MKNVKIIGSSHVAKESVNEIRKDILLEKPEIVCVELDKNRFVSLFQKQRKLKFSDLKVGGFGALFMIIGRWLQKKLGDQVGIMPVADMKTAVLAAREVKAKIYLIDIPIQKTLFKLSKEVPMLEKLKLVFYIIFSPLSPKNRKIAKQFDLNKVPKQEFINQIISEMRLRFPKLFKVLLDDRNVYMANQLKKISKDNPDSNIIAVVGAGHEKDINFMLNPKIHNVAKTFIKNSKTGKFLFLYRDNKPSLNHPGTWTNVGGWIKKGETPLQSVKQKVKQEIGVNVYDFKLLEKQVNPKYEKFGAKGKKTVYMYIAKTDASLKDVTLTDEPDAKFWTLDHALKQKLYPRTREMILKHRKELEA